MPKTNHILKQNRSKIIQGQVVQRKVFEKVNIPLIILVIVLLIAGLLMIFSASAVIAYSKPEYNQDTFYFFKRQIVWILIGGAGAFVMYLMPVKWLKNIGFIFLIGSILLMIYMLPEALSPFKADNLTKTIEMPFVDTIESATRWMNIGGFSLQPAEFIKLGLIIFTSYWFTMSNQMKSKIEKWINQFKKDEYILFFLKLVYFLFPIVVIGIVSILIMSQRDLDTVVVIVLTFIVMYYAAAENKAHFLVTKLLLLGSGVIGVAAMYFQDYRRKRLDAFLEILFKGQPSDTLGSSFQVWNGLIALGTGGLFGVGYGNSRQKLFFLNEAAYTDSIFVVFAEEFGWVGTILLILAFIYFLSLGLQIAINSKDKFLTYATLGITSWISIQTFLNIAANLAVIPFGGMPLPFFTYGGSNTIMILLGVGVLLNASRESNHVSMTRRSDSFKNLHLAK